jgi:hypothetical protein
VVAQSPGGCMGYYSLYRTRRSSGVICIKYNEIKVTVGISCINGTR